MEVGSADFPNARSAMNSPLAKALYGIDGKIVVAITLQVCIVMRTIACMFVYLRLVLMKM